MNEEFAEQYRVQSAHINDNQGREYSSKSPNRHQSLS
jgi:hypothetical protein